MKPFFGERIKADNKQSQWRKVKSKQVKEKTGEYKSCCVEYNKGDCKFFGNKALGDVPGCCAGVLGIHFRINKAVKAHGCVAGKNHA